MSFQRGLNCDLVKSSFMSSEIDKWLGDIRWAVVLYFVWAKNSKWCGGFALIHPLLHRHDFEEPFDALKACAGLCFSV